MDVLNKEQKELLDFFVRNKVIQFGDFTLKSGRKSPYFFNARNLSNGEAIKKAGEVYALMLLWKYGLEGFDVLYGPAYAGIPLVTTTAIALKTKYDRSFRFAYDRKEEKEYGDSASKKIVGEIRDADRIVMIDDTITDGKAKIESRDRLLKAYPNVTLLGIFILFNRMEVNDQGKPAWKIFHDQGLHIYSALHAPEVFEYLHNREIDGKIYVTDKEYNEFKAYFEKYGIKE